MSVSRSFPVAIGDLLEGVRDLGDPEDDDVDPIDSALPSGGEIVADRWRRASFLLPLIGAAARVTLRYRNDSRKIWSISVAEPTARVPLRLAGIDLRADLAGVVAALGRPDEEAQTAPILREHDFRRGDLEYAITAYTAEEEGYAPPRRVGFLDRVEVRSVRLGPPGYDGGRRERRRCCYIRTERTLPDFAVALAQLVALPKVEFGQTFRRPSAAAGDAGGSIGFDIVEHRDERLLELAVRGPPAIVDAVRQSAARLGAVV